MTERQQRLHEAGLLLVRGAALFGGTFGMIFFLTSLTGQQRLILLFLVAALAMPVALFGLAASKSGESPTSKPESDRRSAGGALNVGCLVGAAFSNAILFVDHDAYFALAVIAISGGLLIAGVNMSSRRWPVAGGTA